MFNQVKTVRLVPRRNVLLTFESGDVVLVDFSGFIAQGGVFAALDDDEIFASVQIEDDGHTLVWPGGIDFFADTLWQEGTHIVEHDQHSAPSNPPPA